MTKSVKQFNNIKFHCLIELVPFDTSPSIFRYVVSFYLLLLYQFPSRNISRIFIKKGRKKKAASSLPSLY
eukprot:UN02191